MSKRTMFSLLVSALLVLSFFAARGILYAAETGTPQKCDACKGAGKVACGNCKGTGEATSNTELYRDAAKRCQKCSGKGKRICKDCGGSGKVFAYPPADPKTCGYLNMVFKVESKKGKPAPSTVTLIIDGKTIEKKTAEGRVRIFDFGKVPLSPGDNHRVETKVFIRKGIAGFHNGHLYIHNVKIGTGKVTYGEGGRHSLKLSDDTRIEDWGEEYTGLYLNTDETGSFKLIDASQATSEVQAK